MKIYGYILSIITAIVLVGCNQPPSPKADKKERITFTVIASGTQSGFNLDMPTTYKLDNQTDWETFWNQHNSMMEPKPAVPEIDFSKNMVIAVVDSSQPSGGYVLGIDKIISYDNRLHINAILEGPGANCMTMGAITQPFIFVELPQSLEVPELHIDARTKDCS